MKSNKTQYLTCFTMLLVLEIVLVISPLGYIQLGPISVTTMHIPVIIGGIVLGKKCGAGLGFVFGLTSMLNATMRPNITSFLFTPFVTIGGIQGNWSSLFIAFVPRILIGFLAGLVFEHLSKRNFNKNLSITISAVVGTLTNTFLVLGSIYLFYGSTYASVLKIAYNTLIAFLMGIIATNGIAEVILAVVVCCAVVRAILPITNNLKTD
ncbi:MAG: ECF transporter S component [Erysipelotrichaceae bacterium]